jgi:hypothetical protein
MVLVLLSFDRSTTFMCVCGVPLSDCSTNKFSKSLYQPSHLFVYFYLLMFNTSRRGHVMGQFRMRLICCLWHEPALLFTG